MSWGITGVHPSFVGKVQKFRIQTDQVRLAASIRVLILL